MLSDADFTDGKIGLLDIMVKAGLAASKGEARRLVIQGGVSVNDEKMTDPQQAFSSDEIKDGMIIKKGKKVFHKITL